ncbi:hypothetical protein [Nonomuraea sp. CA-141351]|uniref:hypothetical protein n=1 Tax=Nonomuraea sp. CA-141351 TaxID=3239996 RepID=UPI003D913B45
MEACVECCKPHTELVNWPSLRGKVCPVCEPKLYTAHLKPEPECIRSYDGGATCDGPVTYRQSYAGTGLQIAECAKHQVEACEREQGLRRRYPELAPADFDPLYAGESWDGDY